MLRRPAAALSFTLGLGMQDEWRRITERLKALGCLEAMALRPGAAQSEFAALEQLIAFGRDEDVKRLLAASFDEYLTSCIAWLESVRWNGTYFETGPDA